MRVSLKQNPLPSPTSADESNRQFSFTGSGASKMTLSQRVSLKLDHTYTLRYVYGVNTLNKSGDFCTVTTSLSGVEASGETVINRQIISRGQSKNPDTPTTAVEVFGVRPAAGQEVLAVSFSCSSHAADDSAHFYLYELDLITETGCTGDVCCHR